MSKTPIGWRPAPSGLPPQQVNPNDNNASQSGGQVVGLGDGGYVVVWNDSSQTFSSGNAVVGQRFDAGGNKVGGDVKISQFPDGNDTVSGGAAITRLPNGNIASVYNDSFNGDVDIY